MAKTPQDHKTAVKDLEMPTVTLGDGKEHRLVQHPEVLMKKTGTIRKIRSMDEMDATFWLVEQLFDEDAMAVIDDMDIDDFAPIIEELFDGLNTGE